MDEESNPDSKRSSRKEDGLMGLINSLRLYQCCFEINSSTLDLKIGSENKLGADVGDGFAVWRKRRGVREWRQRRTYVTDMDAGDTSTGGVLVRNSGNIDSYEQTETEFGKIWCNLRECSIQFQLGKWL